MRLWLAKFTPADASQIFLPEVHLGAPLSARLGLLDEKDQCGKPG